MMADIDKFLNTWVSCVQTMNSDRQVGRIDKGFLHRVKDDVTEAYIYVISFNKKDNPNAREGFNDYKHPKGLPYGWSLGTRGTRSFKNMQSISCTNLWRTLIADDILIFILGLLLGALVTIAFSMYAISHIPYHTIGGDVYKCERIDQ